jgi:hypothetical protein
VIAESGDASMARGIEESFAQDLHKAESTSMPITLFILVLAFGALVAAGVPLLLAVTGVAATLGLVGPISHIAAVDQTISNVILLIGLAVGVDYSLFYLKRVREERAAGRVNGAAIEAAAATSGRAVLVSGFTVMIAMGGMYLGGSPTFSSLATGTILVVAVSVIGSLTVLPAVLSALGDRVEKGRLPLRNRLRRRQRPDGVWSRIVERVLRRPVLSAIISGGILVALAIPALGMHISMPGTESLSRDIPAVRSSDRIQAAFPSQSTPVTVVVKAHDVTTPAIARSIRRLDAAAAGHRDLFTSRPTIEVSRDKTVARISIPAAGTGIDRTSHREVAILRGELIPAAFAGAPDASVMVGGVTAQTADFNTSLATHTPLVFAFVLIAAFVLLLMTFRSLCHRGQGDRLEPPQRRRLLRGAGARLPERVGREAARLPLQRRDRRLAPAVPVRGAVRPVDGLSRVHPQPCAGGLRHGDEHRACRRPCDWDDRGRRDQRGHRDGRRVRTVRHALEHRPEGDGGRARGRRASRRDDRPRDAPAGKHEAARRLELVASAQTPLASSRVTRGRASSGGGMNRTPPSIPIPVPARRRAPGV